MAEGEQQWAIIPFCRCRAPLILGPRWHWGMAAYRMARGQSESTKYFLFSAPNEVTLEQLMFVIKMRWRIEWNFQEIKLEFGLPHFKARLAGLSSLSRPVCRGLRLSYCPALQPWWLRKITLDQNLSLPGDYIPRGSQTSTTAWAKLYPSLWFLIALVSPARFSDVLAAMGESRYVNDTVILDT